MSEPGKIGKAIGKQLPQAAPVLLWLGVGYLIWRFGKDLLDQFSKLFKTPRGTAEVEETLPILPNSAGVIWASIIEPPPNGRAARSDFGEQYPMRISVTYPGEVNKRVELRVVAKEFPPWPLANKISEALSTVELKKGRNVVQVTMPVSSSLVLPGGVPTTAYVEIDGTLSSGSITYSIPS